jgi:hypothetical protein
MAFRIKNILNTFCKKYKKLMSRDIMHLILDKKLSAINQKKFTSSFIRLRTYPKVNDNKNCSFIGSGDEFENIALIIQGPIVHQNKFTAETVKWYANLFPKVTIIVSTWNTDETKDIEAMCSDRIILIKSDPPSCSGILNFNYQLKSTLKAIECAKERGLEHVLKSRSDQRIYNKDLMFTLLDRMKQKIKNNDCRLVLCDTFSYINEPFHYSDMLMFGTVSKMFSYWNVRPMIKEINKKEYDKLVEDTLDKLVIPSIRDLTDLMPPEIYLGANFAKKQYGGDVLSSPNKYHERLLREQLTFVDFRECDIYWYKYNTRLPLGWFDLTHDKEPITHSRWIRFIS